MHEEYARRMVEALERIADSLEKLDQAMDVDGNGALHVFTHPGESEIGVVRN